METALLRQPRGNPAQSRAQLATRLAVGLVGGLLMAGAALLQPFAAPHLLPGRSNVEPVPADASPPAAVAAAAAEPAAPTPRLVSPLAAAPPVAAAREPAAPAAPSSPAAVPVVAAPPAPREPLPLQTDLIVPSPAGATAPSVIAAPPAKAAAIGPHG